MGAGSNFSKLKKAIAKQTVVDVVNAMFNLRYRSDKFKHNATHGENIAAETIRALKTLNISYNPAPPKVVKALRIAKERAGELWDKSPSDLAALNNAKELESKSEPVSPEPVSPIVIAKNMPQSEDEILAVKM